IKLIRELNAEHYDLIVNPSGNDRSTILTAIIRAGRKVGRLQRNNNRWLWRRLHDEVMEHPYNVEPVFIQKWKAWTALSGGHGVPEFRMTLPENPQQRLNIPANHQGRLLHLSPFGSVDSRSLPTFQIVELLEALHRRYPGFPVAISCAPTPRELGRIETILQALSFTPEHVFKGNLSIPQLAEVLSRSALHFGADSGALHLARALNTPAVAWFLWQERTPEWAPLGEHYRVIGTDSTHSSALLGIRTQDLLDAAARLMERTVPALLRAP
ncbi:MAG: glycosyltransferase family 9 protein, partial [Stenotrophobium sp.]